MFHSTCCLCVYRMMQRTKNFSTTTKEDFMKSLATMTAIAALIAGMSIASAQNSAGSAGASSPGNLNAAPNGPSSNTQSGTESKGAASVTGAPAAGQTAQQNKSPSDPNFKPVDNGDKTASGMQPKGTQSQTNGSATTPHSTTTTGTKSPADPSAKPPGNAQ